MSEDHRGDTRPRPDTARLWWVDLDAVTCGTDLLSAEERTRAARFSRPQLQHRYASAHMALRLTLGSLNGVDPRRLRFQLGSHGKPFLVDHPIPFNLSHSDGLGLIGAGGRDRIGVDCERQVRHDDLRAVAEGFCSAQELASLSLLTNEHIVEGFYAIWTRKEAVLKAAGCGLSVDPTSVQVGLGGMETFDQVEVPSHGLWWVCSIRAPSGYSGAYAVDRETSPTLPAERRFEWNHHQRSPGMALAT